MSNTAFSAGSSPIAAFLREEAKAKSFPARNFLLDEGVSTTRADSYYREAGTDFKDKGAWNSGHAAYLKAAVRIEQTRGIPKNLNPKQPDRCPETFRDDDAFRLHGQTYKKLKLIRMVEANFIARRSGFGLGELLEAARTLVEARDRGEPADDALELLGDALALWGEECGLWPVWASFLDDHKDLFGADMPGDTTGWADELRDRLGLNHYCLGPGAGSLPVFVFSYPATEVPSRRGFKGKPLATPTVLDGDLSEAFCPAPANEPAGRLVHLAGADREPAREVLHPFFVPKAEHLFRVGEVTRSVTTDLGTARGRHLQRLRARHANYGDATDRDLLESLP